MTEKTIEPQYQVCLEIADTIGLTRLGLMSNQVWRDDPRRLVFMLARYKFVSKMLAGKRRVLEAGCADAFGARIVKQEVGEITVADFDPVFIRNVEEQMDAKWPMTARVHDFTESPLAGPFDAAYALDVLEHIRKEDEERFLANIVQSLTPEGIIIIGMPSIQSQAYASAASREGHVNCKDHKDLESLIGRFFHNVFLFSMNDEVVHTGFYPMAHYLIAIGCTRRP